MYSLVSHWSILSKIVNNRSMQLFHPSAPDYATRPQRLMMYVQVQFQNLCNLYHIEKQFKELIIFNLFQILLYSGDEYRGAAQDCGCTLDSWSPGLVDSPSQVQN